MRHLYLLIIGAILFQSCSFTQRRYLPGFSVEWNHGAPKTNATKNTAARNYTIHYRSLSVAAKSLSIPIENPWDNMSIPAHFQMPTFFQTKTRTVHHIVTSADEPLVSNLEIKNVQTVDAPPHDNATKEVCGQSKVSMHTGMMSLTVTLFSFVIGLMLIVLKNTGVAWATASLTGAVVIGGIASGGALGIMAVVFGIIALHKINKEQDLYTGKSKAVTGIVFASILFGVLSLLVV